MDGDGGGGVTLPEYWTIHAAGGPYMVSPEDGRRVLEAWRGCSIRFGESDEWSPDGSGVRGTLGIVEVTLIDRGGKAWLNLMQIGGVCEGGPDMLRAAHRWNVGAQKANEALRAEAEAQ